MEDTALKLRQQRAKFDLTLEQVERETLVRSNVIVALEENNMNLLPAMYIQSFVKTLTDFYQKIEEDAKYLSQVKSYTSSKNKAINVNTKNAEQIINKIKKPQSFENTDKIKDNKTEKSVKTENTKDDFVAVSQIQNVFTSEKIKLEVAENSNPAGNNSNKFNSDKFNFDENVDGFSIKEKVSNDANSNVATNGFDKNIVVEKNIQNNNSKNNHNNDGYINKINAENLTSKKENFTTEKKPNVNRKSKIKQKSIPKSKRYFVNSLNISSRDLFIYLFLFTFLGGVIFFVFFYDENMLNNFMEKMNISSHAEETNGLEDTVMDVSKNELFTYFEPIDSIILVAKCRETAWVKVEIDSKNTDDLLMQPGMEKRWSAWERIVLNTSNIGGIAFYKNDTLLPNLGASGSLVKNIVITREGLANVTPLTTSNNPVSANELNPTQVKINSSGTDTTKTGKEKLQRRKKDTTKPTPIIDFSTPPTTKPTILE